MSGCRFWDVTMLSSKLPTYMDDWVGADQLF